MVVTKSAIMKKLPKLKRVLHLPRKKMPMKSQQKTLSFPLQNLLEMMTMLKHNKIIFQHLQTLLVPQLHTNQISFKTLLPNRLQVCCNFAMQEIFFKAQK